MWPIKFVCVSRDTPKEDADSTCNYFSILHIKFSRLHYVLILLWCSGMVRGRSPSTQLIDAQFYCSTYIGITMRDSPGCE